MLRLVGQGGFGKVYQVRKRATGRIMALKAMRKHMVIDELNVEGTKTERQVLESVDHPYIIRLGMLRHACACTHTCTHACPRISALNVPAAVQISHAVLR